MVTSFMMSNWAANMSACGDRETMVMERAFLAVAQNGADPSLILYDSKAFETMGPVGLTSVPGFKAGRLLIGDINRDGKPEVINITPDQTAMQVFGLSDDGAYVLLDTLPSPVRGSIDMGALIIDAKGDGDDRIVCAFELHRSEHRAGNLPD